MKKFIIPENYITDKYIGYSKHPSYDLTIYSYSRNTLENSYWNDITLNCRGLVLDSENNIIARAMPKFFNIQEYQDEIPNEPYKVYEKMDGSLILVFKYKDEIITATKRSFESDQAKAAAELLKSIDKTYFKESKTYLFELIHPDNRIVVNYEDVKGLFYITTVNNETGLDEITKSLPFPYVKEYDNLTIDQMKNEDRENHEGYVIKFAGGLRLKIKHPTYFKLHRIMSMLTTEDIWREMELEYSEILSYIKEKDPELYLELSLIRNDLNIQFSSILIRSINVVKYIRDTYDNNKERALFVQKYFSDIQHVVYAFLHNRNSDTIKKIALKHIKPKKIPISKIYDGIMLSKDL